jgi:hypothetical protein
MSSGSKKRNPDMHFLFLSKVPVNKPPAGSSTGPLLERAAHLQGLFYLPLKFFIKIALNKEFFSFSPRP